MKSKAQVCWSSAQLLAATGEGAERFFSMGQPWCSPSLDDCGIICVTADETIALSQIQLESGKMDAALLLGGAIEFAKKFVIPWKLRWQTCVYFIFFGLLATYKAMSEGLSDQSSWVYIVHRRAQNPPAFQIPIQLGLPNHWIVFCGTTRHF